MSLTVNGSGVHGRTVTPSGVPLPLISIFTSVKNGAKTIRRCMDSVLDLDYPNIEHIVQDGASTDGTLEILRDYELKHPDKVRVVSELDSCAEEGFFRALRRCKGKWIGSCLADEALLPGAASWAAEAFRIHPSAGAVYGDLYITDSAGNIRSEFEAPHPFSIEKFLLHEVIPPLASSFFRLGALKDINLRTYAWTEGMGEFEMWVRLGLRHEVQYVPGLVATHVVHPGQLGATKEALIKGLETRCAYFAKLCGKYMDRFGPLQVRFVAGLHLFTSQILRDGGMYTDAADLLLKGMALQPNAEHSKKVMLGFLEQGSRLAAEGNLLDATACWEPLEKLGVKVPNLEALKIQARFRGLEPSSDSAPSAFVKAPASIDPTPALVSCSPNSGIPAVSVIVLCHNYAKYLRVAVESVLAQSYRDFELIIVDDGSSDDSQKIAKELADQYGNAVSIRLFRLEDVGPAAARNYGVEQSLGRYFLPLDADDRLSPEFLELTVPVLEGEPNLGYAYTDSIYFGDSNYYCFHPEYDFTKLCSANFVATSSLVRRDAFNKVDGYDRSSWAYHEDWDFWIKLGEAGRHGRHVPKGLFYYNHHTGSSLSFYATRLDSIFRALRISQHPRLYPPTTVEEAKATLSEMPSGWNAMPPMKGVAKLQELLNQFPNNRHLLYFLAIAQFRDGSAGDAVSTLNTLISTYPQDTQARETLEQFSIEILSRDKPAVTEVEPPAPKALAQNRSAPVAEPNDLRKRASDSFAERRWLDSVQSCAQIISKSPDDAEILHIMAQALVQMGLKEDALKVASHLTKLKPSNKQYSELFANLGRTGTAVAPTPAANLASPNSGRIVALISAYNEGDVIYHVIGDLIANGVEVYLLDNNSTDNTISEASKWLGKGLIKVERFPEDAGYAARCGREYIWKEVLRRKEELATQLGADWYLHADADEFRESPWPGKTLAEAIREVDLLGYNALNFALFNFRPTDNAFVPGSDVRLHLTAFEPGDWFDSVQIKAWKNTDCRVDLVSTGGHSVAFNNRKVFPVNFILRHYPIRSEEHGKAKVFKDRIPRFNKEERAAGWHVQYNDFANGKSTFLHDRSKLVAYDSNAARAELLGRSSLDLLFLSSMAKDSFIHRAPDPDALLAWMGRRLGMTEPLAPAIFSQASQIHDSILPTQAFGEKELPLKVDEYLAGLLLALNQVKSAYARLQGNSRMALAAHTLERVLERRRPPNLRADAIARPAASDTPAAAA